MRIVFVGPGAIGCLFAGLLAEAFGGQAGREGPHEIWLLDKDPARAEVIDQKGVRIDDKHGSHVVQVNITAEASHIGSADLVCLCVKSYDTGAAIRHSLQLIGTDTIVVSMQNGSGNVEQIAEVVDNAQIVCAITAHGSTNLGPGHIRHAGVGSTLVASFVPRQRQRASQVVEFLTKSGIDARVVDDMQSMIWSKLVINAAINPLTAISNVQNGQLLKDPELRETMRKAASEAAAVAKAQGITLMYDNEVEEVENVCRATEKNFSSMLQDVRKGRRTEVDSITGVIVKEAYAAGIEVPTNEMLLKRMYGLSQRRRGRGGED